MSLEIKSVFGLQRHHDTQSLVPLYSILLSSFDTNCNRLTCWIENESLVSKSYSSLSHAYTAEVIWPFQSSP